MYRALRNVVVPALVASVALLSFGNVAQSMPPRNDKYAVAGMKAERGYFFSAPQGGTQTGQFIIKGDVAKLIEERGAWYYAVYTNPQTGTVTAGWMLKHEFGQTLVIDNRDEVAMIKVEKARFRYNGKPGSAYLVFGDVVKVLEASGRDQSLVYYMNAENVETTGWILKSQLGRIHRP
ncbi:MAG: hypothetical protein HY078_03585 [Elusimicrobia bacterium]|nr:hypothetical protein [Elusimicrobiota bacterium]